MKTDSKKLKKIKVDLIELEMDEDEVIYYGKCVECNKPLTLDERAYGHDCE